MPRKKSATLTQAELRIMKVLWETGGATVAVVVAALSEDLAYTTVLTTLRVLERKGCVRHKESGRAFTYVPLIDRGGAQRTAVNDVVSKFFNNSPGLLALNLLQDERLSAVELTRLRRLIDEQAPENST